MGTEVLRPQDCIREAPAIFHHRKSYSGYGNNVPKVNRKQVRSVRPEQRRKSPDLKRSATDDDFKSKNSKIVLGQVTILRRGESLDTKIKANQKKSSGDVTVYGTGRLGPDPKLVPKQVRFGLDTYAGSAFSMSPAPSSLPLPSFFNKKDNGGVKAVDDLAATRDLRRLLRLE